jgi:hypothetical protein
MAADFPAEDEGAPLLPRTQSRLRPVVVVAALEMPQRQDDLVVVKRAVAFEAAQPHYPVVPASATNAIAAPEAKGAPVVPSWALPKPIKKATSIPITNPYVVPRTVR